MTSTNPLPKLITFDGEARSGKGTIVSRVKDVLRDEHNYKVMLIDAGQVFRCLVVAAMNRGVNLADPDAIDGFLSDEESAEACVQFIKAVYHMEKVDRDAMLYSSEIGANSAKIGARPLSQEFKDKLLEKWLRDARVERYDIVLLDGRALEEVGIKLERKGLCNYIAGLYFVCDPKVGALRTLGFATKSYSDLEPGHKQHVDELVAQIVDRNDSDRNREVQPIRPPESGQKFVLPNIPDTIQSDSRFMATIDTGSKISKLEMTNPVVKLILNHLN